MQKKKRALSVAIGLIVIASVMSAVARITYVKSAGTATTQGTEKYDWVFWYKATDEKPYAESYTGEEACKKASANWSADSTHGPILFRCAHVDGALLAKAKKSCKRNEAYACQWKDWIEKELAKP